GDSAAPPPPKFVRKDGRRGKPDDEE
ncbi:MAG: hypothetical protein QOC71_1227, partial [Thermoplasmata archaeon]|nr:hypothetical protein [Thermoplasmata archaeon]